MSFVTSNEHRQSAAELTVFASFVSRCMMQSFVNCLTLHLMRLLDKIGLQDNSVINFHVKLSVPDENNIFFYRRLL